MRNGITLSNNCTLTALCWSISLTIALADDAFFLKSGGKIEGEWLNPKRQTTDSYELKSAGLRIILPREQVTKVDIKSDAEKQYEKLLPRMPNTLEGHWKMAEWCREVNLKSQRELHLQEVLQRDPNHEGARLGLGYQRFEGAWEKPEDRMQRLGYSKFQGRWVTPQELALMKTEADATSLVIEWRQKIKVWKSWLTKKRDLEARENFREIHDPLAATALIEVLTDVANSRDLRLLALSALENLPGHPGENTFIQLAIEDKEEHIREKCLVVLTRYGSKSAVFRFIELLKNSDNALVNRGAIALGHLRDPIAVSPLINALNTTHEFTIVPGSNNSSNGLPITSSFSQDGSNAGGLGTGSNGGMTWGTPKPVKVKRELQNDAVLGALTAIVPGVNFVFDEPAWKNWYTDKFEVAQVNLRRAE